MNEQTSFLGHSWILPPDSSNADLITGLIENRGIKNLKEFLNSDFSKQGHAPKKLKDLTRAVERIRRAIDGNERIFIVGDYDADGITATAILFQTFRALNAQVSARLPHRVRHGYGLNEEFIREARTLDVKLIITVDNGISAVQEVALANSLGIEVIITDHHLPASVLPNAFATINPQQVDCTYPNKALAGAAVAYKLALALLEAEGLEDVDLQDEILVFATIGTLADVCSLLGENRALVKKGIQKIAMTKNSGLRQILKNAGLSMIISTEDVGFRIAPRINASGRISDPLLALQTLIHPDGARFADKLEELNCTRRMLTQEMIDGIEEQLGETNDKQILIASNADWHAGIIGLAAGKLAEKFYRPVVLMAERNGELTGSCRCPISEFNIVSALTDSADLLKKFGGHRAAGGFTLATENREIFEKRLTAYAKDKLAAINLVQALRLDLVVTEQNLSHDFLMDLQKLAPFGQNNHEPILFWRAAKIQSIRKIGKDKNHLRITVGDQKITAVAFGFGKFAKKLEGNVTADLAFTFTENTWNGNTSLQLKVVDIRQ